MLKRPTTEDADVRLEQRLWLHALAALCLGGGAAKAESIRFDDYFAQGALRVDVVHSGTRTEDEMSVRRVVKEPVWSGPTEGLLPTFALGQYRIDVVEEESGTLIYRYGFSTLFGEWITTDEAKTERRSFEDTFEMPCPKRPVTLSAFVRGASGEMKAMFSTRIDPSHHQIGRPPLRSAGAEVIDVLVSGPPSATVDLAILGDGYTLEERVKFVNDCAHFAETFFAVEPFKTHRQRFNVRAVFVPSREAGIDEPRKGIYRDTPFGAACNTFDVERYCMTQDVWAMHDALSDVPHDAILLMANSSRYAGGAIYNHYTVFVSDNEYDDYLPVHEFGHGFGGLADEYYTSAVAYNEFYPPGVEPWEPNITALLDPANVKWKRFVAPGTPIPTREDDPKHAGGVGAFEGAGYAAKGLFRPAKDCKMFSKGNRDFCEVCEQGLIDAIDYYAPRRAR
jgi:hypothetical protein